MLWKKILKIDMEEARRLGDRYAPDDMEQGRKDRMSTIITERDPAIRMTLERYIDTNDPDKILNFREAIISLIRDLPNPPRLSRRTDYEGKMKNYHLVDGYLDSL